MAEKQAFCSEGNTVPLALPPSRFANMSRIFLAAFPAIIFALDVLIPLGTAVTVLYAVGLVVALLLPNWQEVVALAVISTVLILLGWLLNRSTAPTNEAAGRALVLVAVWMMASFAAWNHAYAALRRSERLLEQTMEVGRCFAFEWDAVSDVVVRSANSHALLGEAFESPSLSTGEAFFRHVHPDDRARLQAILTRLTPTRPEFQVTFRIVRDDGSVIYLQERGRAVFNTAGKLLKLIGMSAEVTERAVAEAAVADSEERLRLALDAAEMGTFDVDNATRELRWSRRQLALMGVAETETESRRNGDDFYDCLHPDDRDRVKEQFETAFVEGKDVRSEFRVVHPDGGIHWLAGFGRPVLDADGKVVRMVGVNFEITQRKQIEESLRDSEALFRQIAENVDLVLYLISVSEARIVYMSPAFERLWGGPLPAGLELAEFQSLVHPDDLPRLVAATQGRFVGEVSREAAEFRLVRPNGEIRWVRDMAFPIYDQRGNIELVVGAAQDITPFKNTEERLQMLVAELTRRNRLSTLNVVSAGLAHELSQPLAAIENYASACQQLLSQESSSAEVREIIAEISRQTLRAGEIVRRAQEFVRRRDLQLSWIDINELINEVARLAQPGLACHRVDLTLQLADPLPLVHCDRVQIAQVLLNLIHNAIDAIDLVPDEPQAQRFVKIFSNEGQESVILKVSDSGSGIAPENHRHIFEPFFSTKERGMGLGLAICQTIIQSHRGTIEVLSQQGRSTTIQFTLPLTARRSEV